MAKVTPDSAAPRHGGDLAFAEARYGRPVGGWLDLSTGVNPNPWPVPPISTGALTRLPQPNAMARLIAAARSAYAIEGTVEILAVPGSELAIRLLPLVAPPGPVAIVSPTYGSHAEAWHRAGRTVATVHTLDHVPDTARVVVLANPNNPDGRRIDSAALAAEAHRLGAHGGMLVVDEAFGDVAPPDSNLEPMLAGLDAVVLRSLGKFFGLPGLRLGFVAGAPEIVGNLARLLGDWPVSGPALEIGAAALEDSDWQATTRTRLATDAMRLRDTLSGAGFTIVGSTDLFVLAAHDSAGNVHEALARQGIWTRAFAERPDWLRFGLPSDDAGFTRLAKALETAKAAPLPTTE